MVMYLKELWGEKSELIYTLLTALSPFFTKTSISDIQKYLGINFANAKKIKNGEKLGRKVYDRIISEEVVKNIVEYYNSDTISRIDMRKSKISKKWGLRRCMYTTIK